MKWKLLGSAFFIVSLFFVVLTNSIESQNKNSSPKKAASLKLEAQKPSVYITFEKAGKRVPLRDDESDKGIWLRLHNNMRYSIRFCAFGISDGEQMAFFEKNSELGLNYEVEFLDESKFLGSSGGEKPNALPDVPVGYPVSGICHYYELEAGKSAVFAVPAEHLVKGLSIKVPFKYEWEEESEDNPTHFAYFNSASIPKK